MSWILGVAAAATALAMVSAAYTETREPAGAEAQTAQAAEAPGANCVTREIALDEGYGVTRTELRRICAED